MIVNKKGHANCHEPTYPLSHELTESNEAAKAYLLLCLFLRNLFLRL